MRQPKGVLRTILVYMMLCGPLILTVACGAGYGVLSNQMVIVESPLCSNLVFGIGIGVGILAVGGLIFFIIVPKSPFHFVVTFPITLAFNAFLIYLTSHKMYEDYIERWDAQWSTSTAEYVFQHHQRCCGWNNLSDRPMTPCHFGYEDGCREIIEDFLEPNYRELFNAFICSFCLLFVGAVPLVVSIRLCHEKSFVPDLNIF